MLVQILENSDSGEEMIPRNQTTVSSEFFIGVIKMNFSSRGTEFKFEWGLTQWVSKESVFCALQTSVD